MWLLPRLSRATWVELLVGSLLLLWIALATSTWLFAFILLMLGLGVAASGADFGIGVGEKGMAVVVSKGGSEACPALAKQTEGRRVAHADSGHSV